MKNSTTTEWKSERELVVTRTFDAAARLVLEAWTRPGLFKRSCVSKSTGLTLLSCEMDVRVGGGRAPAGVRDGAGAHSVLWQVPQGDVVFAPLLNQ